MCVCLFTLLETTAFAFAVFLVCFRLLKMICFYYYLVTEGNPKSVILTVLVAVGFIPALVRYQVFNPPAGKGVRSVASHGRLLLGRSAGFWRAVGSSAAEELAAGSERRFAPTTRETSWLGRCCSSEAGEGGGGSRGDP